MQLNPLLDKSEQFEEDFFEYKLLTVLSVDILNTRSIKGFKM